MVKAAVEQLGLRLTFAQAREMAERNPHTAVRSRALAQTETAHDLLSAMPASEHLTFCHAGLCQTSLPHARPASNTMAWKRRNGRFTLWIRPGVMEGAPENKASNGRSSEPGEEDYVGIPFGPKARLIMFHLQTEGLRSASRTVSLGRNLSSFLRSLGLEPRGGPRGTIRPIREQALRIGRCTFTMQWDSADGDKGITDFSIVEGMVICNLSSEDWSCEVQLTAKFHDHLRKHAVPLDKRGIKLLSNNSLGLDLYALMAHRLPNLKKDWRLSWSELGGHIGSDFLKTCDLSRKVRETLPMVLRAYPGAKVEIEAQQGRRPGCIILRPSPPAVPKVAVQGFRLVQTS